MRLSQGLATMSAGFRWALPMTWIASWLTWAVVALALASLLVLIARRRKSDAEVVFAVFCGSLSLSLLRQGWDGPPQWFALGMAVGGCATCNAYWLLARALFRGKGGVQRRHVAIAAGIAVLIVGYRMAKLGAAAPGWIAALGALLTLASSTVLVLAFVEALRGWSAALPRGERRLRLGFMTVYGSCVVAASVAGALAEGEPAWQAAYRAVVAGCAFAILVFTHVALLLRRREPRDASPPILAAAAKPEDQALARAILQQLDEHAVYREPELKVADLARRLRSAEHKVSRVVTQVLGERNFNQLVNRYRIAHACRLLASDATRSVLDISAESGFASPGPFNRAFKAAMGCTPTAWRSARGATPAVSADDGRDVRVSEAARGN